MPTPVDGEVEQQGDLQLSSTAFKEGGGMPDWVGYANENESPRLEISGVPADAETLALVMDDPESEPVVGHVWDHWLAWDIPADTDVLPRGWTPGEGEGTVGYNDYVEDDWGGPAPPEGAHTYYFKLFALDSELGAPAPTRKSRLGSMMFNQSEILATTQLTGTYDAEQGTIF